MASLAKWSSMPRVAASALRVRARDGELDAIDAEVRATVEGYNKDDCVSTLRLRDWLESVRADASRGKRDSASAAQTL